MKLLNKTSIYYLLFALPVFAVCSGLMYYFISSKIIASLDESLAKEKSTIELNLKKGEALVDLDDEVVLNPIEAKTINSKIYFSDTLIYDSLEAELIPYRMLKGFVRGADKNYSISIRTSHIESDDLIESIVYPILILFVVLLLGFFLINWFVSKKIWSPFYKTLEKLNLYKIDDSPIRFESTAIQEFSELNQVLGSMIEKIQTDYNSQKQFIENASHEIQTPLAIIKNKIELLIQSSTISENDVKLIQSVYNASNKLSSLNKALLLLSKIENNQFKETENIHFNLLIDKTLEHFEDFISLKNIAIEKKYDSQLFHKLNPMLADILVSNLVQNAIRHNIKDGLISIHVSTFSFEISNSSNSEIINTDELFKRFRKNEASSESIGLGLAIVREICDSNGLKIEYKCMDGKHIISLHF